MRHEALVGALLVFSLRADPRRHASAVALALCAVLVAINLVASIVGDVEHDSVAFIVGIPVIAGAFLPWRPRNTALVGALLVATLLSLPLSWVPVDRPLLLGVTVANVAVGMCANQIHRRLWHRLEQTHAQLIASDRMSSLGRLVAGIAHELKTPCAAASNAFQLLDTLAVELDASIGDPRVGPDDLREILAEIRAAAASGATASERATRFLRAIRAQTMGMHETDIVDFAPRDRLDAVAALLTAEARRAHVALDLDVDPGLVLHGDPFKFDQIFVNLLGNAIQACGDQASTHAHTVSVTCARDGDEVLFVVQDDGPGIPAEVATRIFDPLFTTHAHDGGTGLGLAISRDLAEGAFGGSLELVPSAAGARFELRVDRRAQATAPKAAWRPRQAA